MATRDSSAPRITQMLDDKRVIESIAADGEWWRVVGANYVTRIECYGEPGDGAYVPAFAVYYGDEAEPSERFNWRLVKVVAYAGAGS